MGCRSRLGTGDSAVRASGRESPVSVRSRAMSPDPADQGAPPERRQAVWPWLLVPLVALAMYFALRSARTATEAPPEPPMVQEQPAGAG
jgi:hypothetical protein